jgi:LPXTG-motif cell wall-anchored protein
VQIPRRVVVLLAALALGVPAAALAQTTTIPQSGSGVSTQPPVSLGDDGKGETETKPKPAASSGELPNTGSDPRLLFLVGVALTLFGVGLRLRTADADDY